MSNAPLVEVNRYKFSAKALDDIRDNAFAEGHWPLVYILSDEKKKLAYVGETTDTLSRLNTHLKHNEKKVLSTVHLISSKRFNKSATLDIESTLIKYMGADGRFKLLNGNLGLVDHNYYQKNELYRRIFNDTWDRLLADGVVSRSLQSIDNSDVFKYSPYKTLSFEQRQGLLGILYALLDDGTKYLLVQGGAGTGKSVLAIFLFKLLHSDETELNLREFSEEEEELRDVLQKVRARLPNPKTALVVPMSSFRKTLQKAFQNVAGLNAKMVIGPAELASQKHDLVLVDESHRLRKRTNLGAYFGAFDKACEKLGLDKMACSEVDWVKMQAHKAVFFYDEHQSVKPSDANQSDFDELKASKNTQVQTLVSQFRVHGGQPYVQFVDQLLTCDLKPTEVFSSPRYEALLFDDLQAMIKRLEEKNRQIGLSRLIAGYSWPWNSKKNPEQHDIEIQGIKLWWNSTATDWINKPGAENEVGCIHTTQGYDLNYAGIIFGNEIRYDAAKDEIVIDADQYRDKNGKQSIKDPAELKQYIINIYKTIMLRAIRGTFFYACDPGLGDYLKRHVPSAVTSSRAQTAEPLEIRPYENAVPFFDLQVAAGNFSELYAAEATDWLVVPDDGPASKDYFACIVAGDSMNNIIPNGSTCLFRLPRGGSRQGKIVLVEASEPIDTEIGSQYTVKEYESTKVENEDGWTHSLIRLLPRSNDPTFEAIELREETDIEYRVIGEFVRVVAAGTS